MNNEQVSEKRLVAVVSQRFFAHTTIITTQIHWTLNCEPDGRILERSGQSTEGTIRRREREYCCWEYDIRKPKCDDYTSKRSIWVRFSQRSFREVRHLHTGLPQVVKGSLQSLFRQSPLPAQPVLTIHHQQPQWRT